MPRFTTYRLCAFALILFLFGCQSDDEKLKSTVFNYLEAEINYSAPHRVFIYLSDADHKFMTSDKFASSYSKKETRPNATFKVVNIEKNADLKKVRVEIKEGEKKEEQTFLLSKNKAGKYRVLLGLKEVADIRKNLEKARRLVGDGAVDEAQSIVDQISSKPFRASHPEIYDAEIESVRKYIKTFTERKGFDRRIAKAEKLKLTDLKKEIEALEKELPKEDANLLEALENLQKNYSDRFKKEAIENFLFTKKQVRTLSDDWGFVKEVSFTAVNNSKRPIAELEVVLQFVNDAGGKAIKEIPLVLVSKDKILEIDKDFPFKKEYRKTPQDWNGKLINLVVTKISFAP